MHKQLCALKGLLRLVAGLEEEIMERYGLTLTEALTLCSVGGGCSSTGDLAAEVALSPSRLSRVLGKLERKGLVERRRRAEDHRNWETEPSPSGRLLLEDMRATGVTVPGPLNAYLETIAQGEQHG